MEGLEFCGVRVSALSQITKTTKFINNLKITIMKTNLKSVANRAVLTEVKSLSGAIKTFNQYKGLSEVKNYIKTDCKGVAVNEKLLTPAFICENWKLKTESGACAYKSKGEIVEKLRWSVNDILTVIKNYSKK